MAASCLSTSFASSFLSFSRSRASLSIFSWFSACILPCSCLIIWLLCPPVHTLHTLHQCFAWETHHSVMAPRRFQARGGWPPPLRARRERCAVWRAQRAEGNL